jgi:nucleoside-diphosphate-sugar epimerase
MKVCVVGGTGNISTSIVRVLLEQGHEVVCFNRGLRGTPAEGTRTIIGDRREDPAGFEQAVRAERFDAAIDMIGFNREHALSSIRAFAGVKHFVHCSTVCTYGVDYDWLPVTEDHPLRPVSDYGRNKAEGDATYMEAFYRDGFPVTIIKPSTTYGPQLGAWRQLGREFSWIDRIRKGKPVLVCGDGLAIHQFLHVDDAALGFVHVLGRERCVGQTYNLVNAGFTTWAEHHRTAMAVLGREVDLVGVPLADLVTFEIPCIGTCRDIFAHNVYYSHERIFRDVPEFRPTVSLEDGLRSVIEAMDGDGRIPDSDELTWEDAIIEAQRRVRDAEVQF